MRLKVKDQAKEEEVDGEPVVLGEIITSDDDENPVVVAEPLDFKLRL